MDVRLLYALSLAFLFSDASAYDAVPRWGQAAVAINDALYVHGGKTDRDATYSYSSAPNNGDLLYLPLSSQFDTSSPPWEIISNSSNSQSPTLAWHTLSALNTPEILLLGGQPGPNSPTVLVNEADSALLLNIYSRVSPDWMPEAASWAGQPIRRIHHSTATTASGRVLVIGGERADGSNIGFSDHYTFDPTGPSFTRLPSENGPPDISGHASVILADGRMIVFGGFCQSQELLFPFSDVWALDTKQPNASWAVLSVSNTSLPSPRRAFAAVLLADGNVLIHGGSDAVLQNNLMDGWVLDTSRNPMVWTQVKTLSQLGARRDHFAVSYGPQVLFGFGYGDVAPFSPTLQIYDPVRSIFVQNFTPLPPSQSQTLPGPSQSTGPTSDTGTGTGTHGMSPTETFSSEVGNPTNGGGDGSENGDDKTTAIAVGTVFGVLGLLVVCISAAYYIHRQRRENNDRQRFAALFGSDSEDREESPQFLGRIPKAGFNEEPPYTGPGWNLKLFGSLGLAGVARNATGSRSVRHIPERRDMLADEDTRDFGGWYDASKRGGTDGSSWSLKSVLGGRVRSREPSVGTSSLKEKADPFSDAAALLQDQEAIYIGATRPEGRRQMSYTSTRSGRSYVDPFADPIQEESNDHEKGKNSLGKDSAQQPSHPVSLPTIGTTLPISLHAHTLSPLLERTSQNTLSINDPATSVSSHSNPDLYNNPFESTSGQTSLTSFEHPHSPGPYSPSIIGVNTHPNLPMQRSGSWWARFSHTSFLDRRASDPPRHPTGMLNIRDPNPPPRLVPIEESVRGDSPDPHFPRSRRFDSNSQKPLRVYENHNKSLTSVKTADSEVIERMGGKMDVIQRVRTGSHRTGSTSTTESFITNPRPNSWGQCQEIASPVSTVQATFPGGHPPEFVDLSPSTETHPPSSRTPPAADGTSPTPAETFVKARVQAYESRMPQGQELTLTNAKQGEGRSRGKTHGITVNYGLVQRPSLYITNPDHRITSSGDSGS